MHRDCYKFLSSPITEYFPTLSRMRDGELRVSEMERGKMCTSKKKIIIHFRCKLNPGGFKNKNTMKEALFGESLKIIVSLIEKFLMAAAKYFMGRKKKGQHF